MGKHRIVAIAMAAGSMAAIQGSPAMAQQQDERERADTAIEEVIVTARFREQTVQDVGESIRAFDEGDLEQLGIDDLASLVRATPSLNVQERGPNRDSMNIRGVSSFLLTQDLAPSAVPVGTYLDDVPLNTVGGAQLDVRFFDLQRVEVLRGPQGTLFGEGASAGAVRYFTQDPDLGALGGKVEVDAFNATDGGTELGARGMINIPLVQDEMALRLSGGRYARPGYIDVIGGEEDVNDFEALNFRGILLAEPTDQLSVRLLASVDRSEVGAFGQVTGNPEDLTTTYPLGGDGIEDDSEIYSARIAYDFDKVELTSITSYVHRERRRDIFDPINSLVLSLQTLNLPEPFAAEAFVQDTTENDQLSQELRLVSHLDGPFDFAAGLFYRDFEWEARDAETISDAYLALGRPSRFASQNTLAETGQLPPSVGLINEGEQISVFFDGSYEVTDRLTLSAGLRWHNEDISVFAPSGLIFLPSIDPDNPIPTPEINEEVSINTVFPRASAEFAYDDDTLLFAQYSTGGRNGNLNLPSTLSNIEIILGPGSSKAFAAFSDDRVNAYEVGIKKSFLDGRAWVNATAFYNDYEDLQVLVSTLPLGFRMTVNAGAASITGFELEANAELSQNWSLFGGMNYAQAELSEPLEVSQITGDSLPKGFELPHSPNWSGIVGGEYRRPAMNGEFFVNGNATYTGEMLTTLEANSPVVGDFTLLNAAAGYRGDDWSVELRVNNVFDEIELTTKNYFDDTAMAVINPLPPGVTFDENFITPPRTIVLTWRQSF